MYKICTTQPARRRQQEMENGLLRYMLRHEYENISVSELCDYMGIPRKAFYRYFSGKEGALYALIDHALLDFAEKVIGRNQNPSRSTVEGFFRYWLTRKDLLKALEHSNLEGLLVQRTIELSKNNPEYLENYLSFIPEKDRNYVLIFLTSGIMSLLVQWERDRFRKTPEEMSEIAMHILTVSFLP